MTSLVYVLIVWLSVVLAGEYCPIGWLKNNPAGTCMKLFDEKKSWKDARLYCSQFKADLAKIYNNETNKFIADEVYFDTDESYWLGLNDVVEEGKFVWLDHKERALWFSWEEGENHQPNNYKNQDCVGINYKDFPKGKWEDFFCSAERKFICEKPQVFCPSGWLWNVSSANCIKLINDKMSWEAARNECRSMGPDLMKILDSKTNEFVTKIVSTDAKEPYWLALNDLETEGKYMYFPDQLAWYTNWATGQPTNHKYQDCVEINNPNFPIGKWDDYGCSTKRKFICERPQALIE